MKEKLKEFDISDPLNSWDRDVTSLVLQQKCNFFDIAKFPSVELLVAENQEMEDAANLGLLQRLQYVFLANNHLSSLEEFKRRRNLVLLDLSGNNLGLRSFLTIKALEVEFLNIYANNQAEDELRSLPDHISPQKTRYEYSKCEHLYPEQGQCLCRILYDNRLSKSQNAYMKMPHVRLFLIAMFPFAASLNYSRIGERERELAERYCEAHFNEFSSLQQQCILDCQKETLQNFNNSIPSQHYFTFKNLIGHYNSCFSLEECASCLSLGIASFLEEIRFPNRELSSFIMQILELLQISRYFAFEDREQQYAANVRGQPKNVYGEMVLGLGVFTPYLFCELLTINHLLQFGQVRRPLDFLQICIILCENDTFANYFIGIAQRETAEKIADRRTTLETLYNQIIQLGEYFLKSVEIDDAFENFVFDSFEEGGKRGSRTHNNDAEIERLFCESAGLTMNSIRFFVFQVRVKSNMVQDLINQRQRSVELRNIDILADTNLRFASSPTGTEEVSSIQHEQHSLFGSEADVLRNFSSKQK